VAELTMSSGREALQDVRQFLWATQRDTVAARDLVWRDGESASFFRSVEASCRAGVTGLARPDEAPLRVVYVIN
jgi:hypothetical protein